MRFCVDSNGTFHHQHHIDQSFSVKLIHSRSHLLMHIRVRNEYQNLYDARYPLTIRKRNERKVKGMVGDDKRVYRREIDEKEREVKKCDAINFIRKINFKTDFSDMLSRKSRAFIYIHATH